MPGKLEPSHPILIQSPKSSITKSIWLIKTYYQRIIAKATKVTKIILFKIKENQENLVQLKRFSPINEIFIISIQIINYWRFIKNIFYVEIEIDNLNYLLFLIIYKGYFY